MPPRGSAIGSAGVGPAGGLLTVRGPPRGEHAVDLIREAKTYRIDSSIQTGKKFGMQLLDDHLWMLYMAGKISAEEMIDRSKNPGDLRDKVHRLGRTIGRADLDNEDVDTTGRSSPKEKE